MFNGVINIYKEKGYTSFHVISVLRHFTGEKKIGHTGTLDPDATGVLPVCIGRATKLVGQLTDTDKQYRAVMLLGRKTDTQDISGNITWEMPADEVRRLVNEASVFSAFEKMTGDIGQIPPMYSAVKVGGVKLVDAARKGKTIERAERHVTVYGYSDITIDMDSLEIGFTVDCSKGTYVRTICEDIGAMMDCPACLKSLERTRSAGTTIEDCVRLDDAISAAENGTLSGLIIPTDRFLLDHEYLIVRDDAIRKLTFGNYLNENDFDPGVRSQEFPGNPGDPGEPGIYRIYDKNGNFYALYRYDNKDSYYKCEKMFV